MVRWLTKLAAAILARERRESEQDLDVILNDQATYDLARAFQTRMHGALNQLLAFGSLLPDRSRQPTTPASAIYGQRWLKRKMTNLYRGM